MCSSNVTSPRIAAWRGFAFENVCFNHISAIKRTLGISGVSTRHSAWTKNDEDGLQIDLIIERNDNIVNMCEIKLYSDDFYFIRHATKDNKNATYLTITIGRRTVIFDLHFMHL